MRMSCGGGAKLRLCLSNPFSLLGYDPCSRFGLSDGYIQRCSGGVWRRAGSCWKQHCGSICVNDLLLGRRSMRLAQDGFSKRAVLDTDGSPCRLQSHGRSWWHGPLRCFHTRKRTNGGTAVNGGSLGATLAPPSKRAALIKHIHCFITLVMPLPVTTSGCITSSPLLYQVGPEWTRRASVGTRNLKTNVPRSIDLAPDCITHAQPRRVLFQKAALAIATPLGDAVRGRGRSRPLLRAY